MIDRPISKTKNRKIDFSYASEYCVTFWTKKLKQLFLKGWGGSACHKQGKAPYLIHLTVASFFKTKIRFFCDFIKNLSMMI